MPCNEDAAYYNAIAQKKEAEFREHHNLTARVACEACRLIYDAGNKYDLSAEARAWFEKHDAADQERRK